MRHLFIINPAAGKGKQTVELSGRIAAAMHKRGADCEIYVTKAPMDATRKIREEAEKWDALRVYACGGDGTLNECVCGAAERPNVAVTHYPCGTGNDFIKAFGDERQRFFALDELLDGEVRPIDVIRVADRYSVNICSVGIDARIGSNVHRYSGIPLVGGAVGYIVSTAAEVAKGVARPIRAVVGDRVFEGEQSLVCVCNGTSYGGFFQPVPEARVDDAVLDVLVVTGVSRLTVAKVVAKYAQGRYRDYPHLIEHVSAKNVLIEAPDELKVNLDGEMICASRVEMSVVAGGLNFIFPAGMQYFENAVENSEENGRETARSTAN